MCKREGVGSLTDTQWQIASCFSSSASPSSPLLRLLRLLVVVVDFRRISSFNLITIKCLSLIPSDNASSSLTDK